MSRRVQWHSLLVHPSWTLQVCPPRGMCTPSCCSWTLITVGISMEGIDLQANWLQKLAVTTDLWPPGKIGCSGAHPTEQELLQQGSGASWVCPLSMLLLEVVKWCFDMIWGCPLGVWPWGCLEGAGHGQLLPVPCPRPPGISNKVICIWRLFVLGLEVPRQG